MKVTYDPRYNIAYIRLKKKDTGSKSLKLSDDLIIDMASDGTIYGIELLNAKKQLKLDEEFRFVFLNEATGSKKEMELDL